jgi:hypothetical protein
MGKSGDLRHLELEGPELIQAHFLFLRVVFQRNLGGIIFHVQRVIVWGCSSIFKNLRWQCCASWRLDYIVVKGVHH